FEGFMAVFNTEALQCDNTSVETYSYLMAFQSCDPALDCTNPMNHMVYLAGSDDGASWTLIDDFEPISGSVPGLVFYDDYLYVFHTQGNARWQKYNACFQLAGQGDAVINGDDGLNGWVDPSLIVSGEDLVLFYLPSQGISDPAGCGGSYPCTREIHSAIAEDESLNSFAQQTGNRASMYIESDASEIKLFCDPDILGLSDGTYLLYVSTGGGTLVYEGTSLSQAFSIPGGGVTPVQIASVGGVPGALQAPDGSVWLYVNKNDALTMTHSIARGISADGKTPIADDAFSVVLDYTISSAFTEQRSVGSPSVINWPGQSWSRDEPPAREGN
ncbi:MAG TPA: hypothetical protein PLZ86_10365, partial [bacterium]|nr:hypothetical protein [bacterium]